MFSSSHLTCRVVPDFSRFERFWLLRGDERLGQSRKFIPFDLNCLLAALVADHRKYSMIVWICIIYVCADQIVMFWHLLCAAVSSPKSSSGTITGMSSDSRLL